MNTSAYLIVAVSFLALTGCSTTQPAHDRSAKADPETVLVTYHVKPGKEAEIRALLSRAWEIYRKERFVFAEPHIVVQDTEDGGKPRVVEIFTWVSSEIPEHAPQTVQTIWQQEQSLCEERNGRLGIEPGEVVLIVPSRK